MQFFPVWLALEQVAFPPGCTGINRLFLSTRHRRHDFTETAEHWRRDHGFAHWRKVKRYEENGQRNQQPD